MMDIGCVMPWGCGRGKDSQGLHTIVSCRVSNTAVLFASKSKSAPSPPFLQQCNDCLGDRKIGKAAMPKQPGAGFTKHRRQSVSPVTCQLCPPPPYLDKRLLVVLKHEAGAQDVKAVLHELLLLKAGRVAALVQRDALQQGVDAVDLADLALNSLIALRDCVVGKRGATGRQRRGTDINSRMLAGCPCPC